MSVTYNVAELVGQVRLLAFDTDIENASFQDEEYAVLLNLNGQDVRLAAAQAIDALAGNEAYVQKFLKTADVMTDGGKTATPMMAYAAELRRQVAEGSGDMTGFFDWAEEVNDPFTQRERLTKEYLRSRAR